MGTPGPGAGLGKSGAAGRDEPFTWSGFLDEACRAGIAPAEFYRSTPREIRARLKGARWRHEQELQRAIIQAHSTAAYVGLLLSGDFPPLSKVLARMQPDGPDAARDRWERWKLWAAAHRFKVEPMPEVMNG